MKKRTLLIVLILLIFTGCARQAEPVAPSEPKSNKDWVNTDILGTVSADMDVRLEDDYNLAVNKDYLLNVRIPDGKRQAGGLYDVDILTKSKLVETMKDQSQDSHDARLVREYYNMLSDWDMRNELGAKPALKYVEKIRSLENLEQMTDYFINGSISPLIGSLFNFSVYTSFTDPDSRVIGIGSLNVSLGDAAEYKVLTENGRIKKEQNNAIWTILLSSLGFTDEEAARIIDNNYRIETLMAEHMLTSAELSSPDMFARIWNPTDLEGVQKMTGDFPITTMLKAWGALADVYNVEEPEYMKAIDSIYTEENFAALKDWLTIWTIRDWQNYLDKDTRDRAKKAENEVLGISGVESEDQQALDMIYSKLKAPIDNMYIHRYCTEEQRSEIISIIKDVIAEYRLMLEEEEWLSPETREKAIEKLDAIRINAVYPDELEDWSDLEFTGIADGGNLLDATLEIDSYLLQKDLASVNEKVDKDVWKQSEMPTSQTNAFYSMQNNSINIMAGILDGIVYQDDFTYEQKLGSIGMVIGHEISHAFDPKGSQFDKDGAFSSWWTDDDWAAFEKRAEKLIAYYDALEPVQNVEYSGTRVQGEAIADLGGVKCILQIARKMDGFDYRNFFESYARLWAVVRVESLEINLASTDSHPLGYLRTNAVVQQFDEFYETYGIKEGDGMYLAEEDRICVW